MNFKTLLLSFCSVIFSQCQSQNEVKNVLPKIETLDFKPEYLELIDSIEVKKELYVYASDEMKGREAGTENEVLATDFLVEKYKDLEIKGAGENGDYLQAIPKGTFRAMEEVGHNVIAKIEGSEKPDEYVVISAHLDHVGEQYGEIFNGADDNGSGTIAILNIAKAFKKLEQKGFKPKRSLIFLHVTGEEKGLLGSKYYVENSWFPLGNTVANLNIDMIGRVDEKHQNQPNYLYLIGGTRLSKELGSIAEKLNENHFGLALDYTYDAPDHPERLYYRSDHYNFAKNNIPSIFFFNGIHEDYHKPTDTADKINYPLLTKRTQYVFAIAWELANRKERLKLD